ncbi:MAG: helix-turn-helix transcriptional regulator [Candidatus Heimdallarchaeaceae archaeon]
MESPKKIISLSLILAIFVLVVSLSSWYVQMEIISGDVCSCAIPLPVLIPILASIGLLTGTLIYYVYSPKFDKAEINSNLILKFFQGDERAVIDVLLKNGGKLSQAKIVSSTGLSKVKVFRILERLKSRGLIEKESKGKTNMIRLSEDISNFLNNLNNNSKMKLGKPLENNLKQF